MIFLVVVSRLWCVRGTDFGREVVPEVWSTRAISEGNGAPLLLDPQDEMDDPENITWKCGCPPEMENSAVRTLDFLAPSSAARVPLY